MRTAFLVFMGIVVALSLTLYFQPNLINFRDLPTPDVVITSPRSGQTVPLKFTVTGFTKTTPIPLTVTTSNRTLFSTQINSSQFSQIIDLAKLSKPGDQLNLSLGSGPTRISLTLTIR